jgi:hypothetical protein
MDHGLAEAGRLGDFRAAGDDGFKHLRAEQGADFADDFIGQFCPAVEYRHHHARDFEARVDACFCAAGRKESEKLGKR